MEKRVSSKKTSFNLRGCIKGFLLGLRLLIFAGILFLFAHAIGDSTAWAVTPSISAGSANTVFLSSDGTVWTWGKNSSGSLGDGTTTDRYTPVQVSGLNNVIAVAADGGHTIALKNDGTVWAWGANFNGQLGDGTTTDRKIPVQVSGLAGVVAIAAGADSSSFALKNDGTVWAWGFNAGGQLGLGYADFNEHSRPVKVPILSGITAIAVGTHHVIALKNDGTVWQWGNTWFTPTQANGFTNVIAIAGSSNTIALKNDGTVWTGYVSTPTQVSGLTNVIAIAGGTDLMTSHMIALKNNGTVWTWGSNGSGQLGDGTTTSRWTPVQVIGLTNVIAIEGGGLHSVAIKNDETVWAWGSNVYGQLGDGTTTNRYVPVQVAGIGETVCSDNDGDGYSAEGGACGPIDCNDNNASIHPGALDNTCNGIDENCSGVADDGYVPSQTFCGVGVCAGAGQMACQNGQLVNTCSPGNPTGDDSNCNGVDENCNGIADDGYVPLQTFCGLGVCAAMGQVSCSGGIMLDTCSPGIPQVEICGNHWDDNCNGIPDTSESVCINVPTPPGQAVKVTPMDPTTGTTPVDITFDNVTGTGTSSVIVSDIGPAIPVGFKLGDPSNFYDITTTALYTEQIQVCIHYSGTSFTNETNLKLFHYDGANWVDVTVFLDTNADIICGKASSLSPFVILEPLCIDNDGDGYGNPGSASCSMGAETDCNDSNPNIHPGALDDTCNGIDENCSGVADEGYVALQTTCGIGACTNRGLSLCVNGAISNSCMPGIPQIEVCNGIDDNCDGNIDDGAYVFAGFQQPINVDGSSIFKLGSTIPVKIGLNDCIGNSISTAVVTIAVNKISSAVLGSDLEMLTDSSGNANTGNLFRYDVIENRYIFNLSTKGYTKGTYKVYVKPNDGSSYSVNFSLK